MRYLPTAVAPPERDGRRPQQAPITETAPRQPVKKPPQEEAAAIGHPAQEVVLKPEC